jgi:hypothetical protein
VQLWPARDVGARVWHLHDLCGRVQLYPDVSVLPERYFDPMSCLMLKKKTIFFVFYFIDRRQITCSAWFSRRFSFIFCPPGYATNNIDGAQQPGAQYAAKSKLHFRKCASLGTNCLPSFSISPSLRLIFLTFPVHFPHIASSFYHLPPPIVCTPFSLIPAPRSPPLHTSFRSRVGLQDRACRTYECSCGQCASCVGCCACGGICDIALLGSGGCTSK